MVVDRGSIDSHIVNKAASLLSQFRTGLYG